LIGERSFKNFPHNLSNLTQRYPYSLCSNNQKKKKNKNSIHYSFQGGVFAGENRAHKLSVEETIS